MNSSGKKFISLFLVFSIMMLSVNLYAKGWRGAKLIITKKDGQQIKDELIAVKPNSLLLLDTEGKDVSVDIEDIKIIKIVKKLLEQAGLGAVIGGAIGLLCGSLISLTNSLPWKVWPGPALFWVGGMLGGAIGVVPGGVIGAFLPGEKMKIETMSPEGIEKVLQKLRKKARIRDYK